MSSHIFKQLIKQHFPVPVPVNNPEKTVETLTEDEKRAIRYSSGYIPRNLLPKLKRSAHSNKESLRMCLLGKTGMYEESEDWLTLVDRGGLTHINSKMFHFMTSMELVVKAFLKNEHEPRDIKTEMLKLIEESEVVKCSWRGVSAGEAYQQSGIRMSHISFSPCYG